MKSVSIIKFKDGDPDRIQLIQTLVTYNSTIGIKKAKDKIDLMISDKIPFEYSVDDEKFDELIKTLEKLNIQFEVK
jgi:hypothetical protein